MDIRDAAAKYLASRARSTGEMKTYLKSKGYEDGEIAAVIADFLDYGYLDDEDYCRQYIKYAFSKGKGPLRVKQELAEKGISRDTIAFALEDYEMEESDLGNCEIRGAGPGGAGCRLGAENARSVKRRMKQ